MKRKDLLKITGCDAKRFENYHWRNQLPFIAAPQPDSKGDPDYQVEMRRANYSLRDAFQLRVFMDVSEKDGLSIEAAKYIAGNCIHHLQMASEAARSRKSDMWIFYAQGHVTRFEGSGERWTPRALGAGRLEDLSAFVEKISAEGNRFITIFNATMASARVLGAAMVSNMIVPDDEPVKPLWDRDYQTIDTGSED